MMNTMQRSNTDRASLLSTGVSAKGSSQATQRRVPQSPSLGTSESPFSLAPRPSQQNQPSNSYGARGTRSIYTPRTNAALDEHSFVNDTSSQLDTFIAQGQAILGNLSGQKDVLKGDMINFNHVQRL